MPRTDADEGRFGRLQGRLRLRLGLLQFISLYVLATLVAFNGPVVFQILRILADAPLSQKLAKAGAFLVLVAFLLVVVLTLLSFISLHLVRLVAIAFLLVNATAYYFTSVYSIAIDDNAIRSVFATDRAEAAELFSFRLLAYVTLLGVLPSLVIARTNVKSVGRRKRLAYLGATTSGAGLVLGSVSGSWFWFDRHMNELGGRALPWSYVLNSALVARAELERPPERDLLPDPAMPPLGPGRKAVAVLVLGESARASASSFYGYARDTTPYTRGLGLVALPDARACETYTIASLICILSHEGAGAGVSTSTELLPDYLYRNGVEVIWRTNGTGEPRITASAVEGRLEVRAACATGGCPDFAYEDWLTWGWAERIARSESDRMLIVIHQGNGSHGPAYASKYPPEFGRFAPVCTTVVLADCLAEELVNAYDNTIVYTDYLLSRIVNELAGLPDVESVMFYVSDHGESLGEEGVYLHGAPRSTAPEVQLEIPLLIWTSPAFRERHELDEPAVTGLARPGHDNIFHSVLGALSIQSPIYKPEFDIFAPRY